MADRRMTWLRRLFARPAFEVRVDGAVARRVRLYHERHKAELAAEDPESFGGDEPITLNDSLASLVECGLEAEEARAGLVGTLFGEVMTREEYVRRKRAAGATVGGERGGR